MEPINIQFEVVEEDNQTWIRMITWCPDLDFNKFNFVENICQMEYSPRVGEFLINTVPSHFEINRIFGGGIDGKTVAGKARKPSSIANKLVEKLMESVK